MRHCTRLLLLALASSLAGCVDLFFSCTNDNQCEIVSGGRCEYTGFCSAPDSLCVSRYRYQKYSVNRLSGQCVVLPVDLAGLDQPASSDQSDMCVGSDRDPNNCGGCGIVCPSGEYCSAGVCGCPSAVPDLCTGDGGTFCTNAKTDVNHCGTCGTACPSGQLCEADVTSPGGHCVETCSTTPTLYTNCATYCADLQNDASNCGACGQLCSANANAAAAECTGGVCSQTCAAGFANCGSDCCALGLSVIAGQLGGSGNIDGMARAARFYFPTAVALDLAGNLFVAMASEPNYGIFNGSIRKIAVTGEVTTLASVFGDPAGVAVDNVGNVYVGDPDGDVILKIDPNLIVTTFAGGAGMPPIFGQGPLNGDTDGTGTSTIFNGPSGIAIDGAGNLYVADATDPSIREVTPAAVVTTLAGAFPLSGRADGTGTQAMFNNPTGVSVDAAGNVYVADQLNNTVRKITPARVVSTLAGRPGRGSADGTGSAAQFNDPTGVAVDAVGNVYVADKNNNTVRAITSAGVVTTLAGAAAGSGSADGIGSAARFAHPTDVVVDGAGNLYLADQQNNTVRKITSTGAVTTLAGTTVSIGSADGLASAALFSQPYGVTADASGNIYIADLANDTIRKITPAGAVITLAGSAGTSGSTDGTGSAARFNGPLGIAVDATGNVFVADQTNQTIRKITNGNVVTTFAGSVGSHGHVDDTGTAAQFYNPSDVAVDASDNLYVADQSNDTIRKITAAGVVTTLAGLSGTPGDSDGTGSGARLNTPVGIALDASGNLYVTQTDQIVRKITSAGVVKTLAGTAGNMGSADGTGSAAQFSSPAGIAVGATGNVYVADTGNATIRKITPGGVVTTVVGVQGKIGVGLGALPATLSAPVGIFVFGNTLIISDQAENAILRAAQASGF